MTVRWTEDQLKAHLANKTASQPDLAQALASLGLGGAPQAEKGTSSHKKSRTSSPTKAQALQSGEGVLEQENSKKRRGVASQPILEAVHTAVPSVTTGLSPAPWLALWFEGARLFSLNECLSIYQYRPHVLFRYKKAWHRQLQTAALLAGKQHFEGPCRLSLFRQGRRAVDLDSIAVMFKFAIDGMRRAHLLAEDNPNIIVEIALAQAVGARLPWGVGMRLDALPSYTPDDPEAVRQAWFPSVSSSS